MLSGTQLDFAYNTLDIDNGFDDASGGFAPIDVGNTGKSQQQHYDAINDIMLSRDADLKKPTQAQAPPKEASAQLPLPPGLPKGLPPVQQLQQAQAQPQTQQQRPVQQSKYYDTSAFNNQFEQEKMANAYLKQIQTFAQQAPVAAPQQQEPGYFEKLFSKKKEFFKLIQWVLIVVLAISVHFFIDHYLKTYISTNDLSPEREIAIRALYPLGILFLLWNLRVFTKP
jgi:hypothetical protein